MEHREESQQRETKTLWREGMVSVRHGKLVMAWDGEVKAGDAGRSWPYAGPGGQGSGIFPRPWGPLLTEAVGGRHISTRSIYLFSLDFNLSMGESFQKDRWWDPQELNKWKPKCYSVT